MDSAGKCKTVGAATTYIKEIKKIMREESSNTEFLFRGQSSIDYDLMPSLSRDDTYMFHERDLIALAKYRKPEVFTNLMLPLETLALLQHFGVPTRLLDVTESALVALYFACQPTSNKNGSKDGVVYVFKDDSKRISNHALLNAVADSAYILNFNNDHTVKLEDFFDAVLKQTYWKSTSAAAQEHKKTKAEYENDHLKGTLFVNAPAFTLRQQIQQGRYILFPNKILDENGEKCFSDRIAPITEDNESVAGKIVISASKKTSILKELQTLGITEYSLFSDSIDIVCKGVKDRVLNM